MNKIDNRKNLLCISVMIVVPETSLNFQVFIKQLLLRMEAVKNSIQTGEM